MTEAQRKQSSPLLHALLQVWQEKLAVKGIDGAHIGEDAIHHLHWERALCGFLSQPGTEYLHKHDKQVNSCSASNIFQSNIHYTHVKHSSLQYCLCPC